MRAIRNVLFILLALALSLSATPPSHAQQIAGLTVTPHCISSIMQWRRPPSPELAARVEMFLLNNSDKPLNIQRSDSWLFDGHSPEQLLSNNDWAWHESPSTWETDSTTLPPQALIVLPFNGRSNAWGVDTTHSLKPGPDATEIPFTLPNPAVWLSAVTFLSADHSGQLQKSSVTANRLVVHIRNAGPTELAVHALKLWLPRPQSGPRVLFCEHTISADKLACFPRDGRINASSVAGFVATLPPLARTQAAIEVVLKNTSEDSPAPSLWASLKIRPEQFDISGGWIASDINGRNSLTIEPYLKTLSRMHINAGQIEEAGGYTDNPEVFARYPFKRFNRLADLQRYDRDELLPLIHAVEFIGEPQYGGGRPVPPQEVRNLLAPYFTSRLHTSVTLSEERTWRYYAGLSDHPHYDAYRVIAPAADSWTRYDRWNGKSIRWGAPLETISEMTRSLRELNRPRAVAYWSQGAHDGWGGFLSPRRGSPTPDELRAQAWHALASRITSLYWFNLSLPSLLKFPDLIEPITRVNREIRILDQLLLEADQFAFSQNSLQAGQPDWEMSVLATPAAAILTVHDLAYQPDPKTNVFRFENRSGTWTFPLPPWIQPNASVFRLDADGTHDAQAAVSAASIQIEDSINVVGIYIVANDPALRSTLQQRHAALLAHEATFDFNPASNPEHLEQLRAEFTRK
ncbi:MAG: hypothetical protein RLZZ458_2522 [Planctomycetota bacterium]